MDSGPLWLDAETMRKLGRDTVDLVADRLTRPWDATPVVTSLSPEELSARLHERAPEEPRPFDQLLARLEADVLPFMARNEHPGYLAYIPGCGTWPSALGDLIASGLNIDAGSWGLSAFGPSPIHRRLYAPIRKLVDEGVPGRLLGQRATPDSLGP